MVMSPLCEATRGWHALPSPLPCPFPPSMFRVVNVCLPQAQLANSLMGAALLQHHKG